jgi:hypothetical protein
MAKGTTMIIGLTGLPGTGKDAVAGILAQLENFTRLAFADPVRSEIAAAFNLPYARLEFRETKEIPTIDLALNRCSNTDFASLMLRAEFSDQDPDLPEIESFMNQPRSPRWIMQMWGTEFRRIHSGWLYWVRQLDWKLQGLADAGDNIVVTDVRFDDEASYLISNGAEIWRITRPGCTSSSHASDQAVDDHLVSVTLDNNSSINYLSGLVAMRLCELKIKKAAA